MPELVRVEAHLLAGAVYNPGEVLSLDGPLLYATVLDRKGEDYYRSQPSKEDLAKETMDPDPDMPLAVHRAGGTWIYCVSDAEPDTVYGSSLSHWNKRVDDGLLVPMVQDGIVDMGRKSKVQINSGQYKSYHMPVWTQVVDRLRWYASVVDVGELRRLLTEHISHIGKRHNRGKGVVTRWQVEQVDESEDRWMLRPDGALARPIPVSMLDGYDGPVTPAPVRPPYWLIQHHEPCAIPDR